MSHITVLLVEDEPLISDVMESALNESGYEVVRAANGDEALRQIEDDPARFCAVVTDIRLGSGADGWTVAQRARELVPHMPIIYMSGDSAVDWASKGVPDSVMLAKPFAPGQLTTAVSTLVTQAEMRSPPGADATE